METHEDELVAKRFLRSGSIGNAAEDRVAVACERVIQGKFRKSIRQALNTAERFHVQAHAHGGRILRQTAWRSLGRMHHFSGQHSRALRCYLEARRLCRTEKLIRGRIDRTLVDIYMYLGNYAAAHRHARAAIRVFSRLGAASDLAQTQVNLGNLYHRQDSPEKAAQLYEQAIGFFEKTDNSLALARCCYNRANVLVQLFRMEEAERLYRQALPIYVAAGYELDACDTRYGLAWLGLLTGRFHQALLDLLECETTYRRAGDPRGLALCLLDRAEVYLHLGLYSDARELAGKAARNFKTLKLSYELAKALLYCAYALAGNNQAGRARRELDKAEKLFASLRHQGYLGAIHVLRAELGDSSQKARRNEIRSARRRFARAQLSYWDAVCDLKEVEWTGRAADVLPRMRRNPAVQCVPHLYAAWQVLEGDVLAGSCQQEPALECWQKAADRLDMVRAALPPMELRNRYSRAADSPHTRLVAVYHSLAPVKAAVWSERSKTAGVWSTGAQSALLLGARRKVAESLEALSAQVFSLSQQLISPVHRSIGGATPTSSPRRLAFLRREVRDCLLSIDRADHSHVMELTQLANRIMGESRNNPIVQLHLLGADILALVHHQGEIASKRFVGGVDRLERLTERWRFCMERGLLTNQEPNDVSVTTERAIWRELGEWLWAGLEIPESAESVVLVPDGSLANLPWQALENRAGLVGDCHTIILTPSLRHHWLAQDRVSNGKQFELYRGAGTDLSSVDSELARLASISPERTTIHSPAPRTSWPVEGEYLIWHYAGHARLASENPFYSYLVLEDGPLFAADFQIRECRVGLVTLAACQSGEEVALPGEESVGFVRALLEMGAKNVLASRWPVADRSTAVYMKQFYTELLKTGSLTVSLRSAEQKTRQTFPSAYHWAAFGLYGAGTLGDCHAKEL